MKIFRDVLAGALLLGAALAAPTNGRAAEVKWKPLGTAPGVVGIAAANGKLFAVTSDAKLLLADPAASTLSWKEIGAAPGGVQAMGAGGGKLFCGLNAGNAGRFRVRDAVETAAEWKDDGHAWCLTAIAGVGDKVYALIDCKEPGVEPSIMFRPALSTPEEVAKTNPNPGRGLDGLPWNGVDRRPPLAALAMTATDGKFYVATKEDTLCVGDPTKPDVKWDVIGDAAGVVCLAGDAGTLFALTKSGWVVSCQVK